MRCKITNYFHSEKEKEKKNDWLCVFLTQIICSFKINFVPLRHIYTKYEQQHV